MGSYIVVRVLQVVPVLILTSVIVWFMIYLIPGDPAIVMLGADAAPEQLAAQRAKMGLDQPVPVQYAIWLGNVMRGDLGKSYRDDQPVLNMIAQRFPVTLQLTVLSLVFALLVAFPLGVMSVVWPKSWISRLTIWYTSLALSVPTFWLGILLVIVFALTLKWLPPSGFMFLWEDPWQAMRLMILPAVTLGSYVSAVFARFIRAALLETMFEDYVRTARSKGLAERRVIIAHALRNAMIPVVTVVGLQFGTFMGGAVITEAIFLCPGIGRLLLQSIITRDYAVVQGTILFVVTLFVMVNLLTDLVYAYLDPRIHYT